MDSADHQAQPGAVEVGGHEREGGLAVEHRRLRWPDAADLEEVVHHPDRVEAGVIRGSDDPGQGRPDG